MHVAVGAKAGANLRADILRKVERHANGTVKHVVVRCCTDRKGYNVGLVFKPGLSLQLDGSCIPSWVVAGLIALLLAVRACGGRAAAVTLKAAIRVDALPSTPTRLSATPTLVVVIAATDPLPLEGTAAGVATRQVGAVATVRTWRLLGAALVNIQTAGLSHPPGRTLTAVAAVGVDTRGLVLARLDGRTLIDILLALGASPALRACTCKAGAGGCAIPIVETGRGLVAKVDTTQGGRVEEGWQASWAAAAGRVVVDVPAFILDDEARSSHTQPLDQRPVAVCHDHRLRSNHKASRG